MEAIKITPKQREVLVELNRDRGCFKLDTFRVIYFLMDKRFNFEKGLQLVSAKLIRPYETRNGFKYFEITIRGKAILQ